MKDAPIPLREIVVIRTEKFLRVYYASEDARKWLESELPVYGTVLPDLRKHPVFDVIIHPFFNLDQVVEYLESYNDPEA